MTDPSCDFALPPSLLSPQTTPTCPGSEFVKAEGELTPELETLLKEFFDKMDDDKNGEVSSCCVLFTQPCARMSVFFFWTRRQAYLSPGSVMHRIPFELHHAPMRRGGCLAQVSKSEAVKFWGKNFAKVNAQSMFNEVDEDGNGNISWAEFLAFWKNVVASYELHRQMTANAFPARVFQHP